MRIAVIGVGQSMRGDDAAGIEAVRMWRGAYVDTASRPEVRVELTERPGLGLLDLLDGATAAVVVDAVRPTSSAGELQLIATEDLAAFTDDSRSAHGWGVAETLAVGRLVDAVPSDTEVILVGIPASQFEVGSGLSEIVESALPTACSAIQAEVERLLGD